MRIRVLILTVIVLLIFIYTFSPCIKLKYSACIESPISKSKFRSVFILYGDVTVCDTCHAGEMLSQYSMRKDIAFIVQEGFSDSEIDNFKYSFNISGEVMRGDAKTRKYLKMVANCLRYEDWHQNLCINLASNSIIRI